MSKRRASRAIPIAYDGSCEQQTTLSFVACTNLLILSVLYTPSENTFDDIQKSGINLTLAGSYLRFQLDVPVDGFRYAAQFSAFVNTIMRNTTHKLQSQRIPLLRRRDFRLRTRFPPREQRIVLRHTLPRNNRLCLPKVQLSVEHPLEVQYSHTALLWLKERSDTT
jgi:uncharacterized protein with von Willebrand factor type A (vWA) domain